VTDTSRRAFLASAGGTLAAAWLATDMANLLDAGRYAAWAGHQRPLPPFEFLSAADAADLDAAFAQIIPSDGTPGAREARAIYFVDKALATWQREERTNAANVVKELRLRARRTAGAASYAALTSEQQHAILAAMEKEKAQLFGWVRGVTIVATLANPEYGGNHEKAGWKMIGFVDQFSWAPPFGWYDANER
jgi:gluconate 2-dehydrogenase gamma chain